MNEQPVQSPTNAVPNPAPRQNNGWRTYALIVFAVFGFSQLSSVGSLASGILSGPSNNILFYTIGTFIESIMVAYVVIMGFINALNWTMTRAVAKRLFIIYIGAAAVGLLSVSMFYLGNPTTGGEGAWNGLLLFFVLPLVLLGTFVGIILIWLALFKVVQPGSGAVSAPSTPFEPQVQPVAPAPNGEPAPPREDTKPGDKTS